MGGIKNNGYIKGLPQSITYKLLSRPQTSRMSFRNLRAFSSEVIVDQYGISFSNKRARGGYPPESERIFLRCEDKEKSPKKLGRHPSYEKPRYY
jgi:hypothetical protein